MNEKKKTEEKIESNQAKSNTIDSLLKLWIRMYTIHITVRYIRIRIPLNYNVEPLRLDKLLAFV